MQGTAGNRTRSSSSRRGPARLIRLSERDSGTAQLLCGCPVVTPEGGRLGNVDYLMVDACTQQLRYVMLTRRKKNTAMVAIPWHALYFDAALGRLVFYTWV